MKVISRHFKRCAQLKKPVVAIGVFDGLHKGHQRIIKQMVKKARLIGGTSVVITFYPHPLHVLKPELNVPLIVSLPHRLKLIELLGVDVAVVINFTKSFAKLAPEVFIDRYLLRGLKPVAVYVGYDFRFGHHRGGDAKVLANALKPHHIQTYIVAPVKYQNHIISSTRIRGLIAAGHLEKAEELLGRPVSIIGKVVKGDGRGRQLGYPTANLLLSEEIFPRSGVYVIVTKVDGRVYYGISNVGIRPSFQLHDNRIYVEAHLFHFAKNIYNKEIEIVFLKRLRPEKSFSSKERLISQIKEDIKKAYQVLARQRKKIKIF